MALVGMVLAMAVSNHHDVPVPLKFAEQVDGANGAGATDLSASTLEFVLKVQ